MSESVSPAIRTPDQRLRVFVSSTLCEQPANTACALAWAADYSLTHDQAIEYALNEVV